MTVVINEFEVVAEPPPAHKPADAAAATNTQKQTKVPTPHDVERMLRRTTERYARIRAY